MRARTHTQRGPNVGLQLFRYLFHVVDLIYPNHSFKLEFHIPYSRFTNFIKYLYQIFPRRWIGRIGIMEWPSCLLKLTTMDIFLWGWDAVKKSFLREIPTQ